MWASAVFKSLVKTGRLMVEDAGGKCHVFGDGETPQARIRIKSRALERRIFSPQNWRSAKATWTASWRLSKAISTIS